MSNASVLISKHINRVDFFIDFAHEIFSCLGSREINSIRQAMAEWERMTCIRFKRRTNEKNYLEFHIGSG